MITFQNYVLAQSLEEAWELNQKRSSRVLGGMMWLRLSRGHAGTVIDLSRLGLDTVTEDGDTFRIGAMVTLRQLELHPALNRFSGGALAAALAPIVGVQFRNMATAGGSVWGRFGFSDLLTLLLSMDCSVALFKGGILPLETFCTMKPDRDILTHILIKNTPGRYTCRAFRNQSTDLPVLTCAVSERAGVRRAVIGARPGRAMVLPDPEGLLAGDLTDEKIAAFCSYAAETVPTGSNLRAGAAFRSHLVSVLLERCLRELGGDSTWK